MLWLLKTQPLISKEVSSRAYLRDSSPATVNLKTGNLKSSATAFSSQAGPSSLTKTENLAASIRHGLEIIDSHRSAALKQSSYRFSLRPRESRPTFPVDKVDVGVQTFLDDNVKEDSSMFTCINCKKTEHNLMSMRLTIAQTYNWYMSTRLATVGTFLIALSLLINQRGMFSNRSY